MTISIIVPCYNEQEALPLFWRLSKYAIDGIINFSQVPLSIASWFGLLMTFVAFVFLVVIIVRKLAFGDPVAGWASTACIIIFMRQLP